MWVFQTAGTTVFNFLFIVHLAKCLLRDVLLPWDEILCIFCQTHIRSGSALPWCTDAGHLLNWNLCILPTFSPWWCMDAGNFGTENCWSNLKFMLLAEKSFPTCPLNLKSKHHEQPSDAIRLCPPVWHQARSLEHPKIQRETRSLLKISRNTPVYSHNTTVYSQQFSSICSSAPQKKWHPPLDGLTNVWKRNNHLHQSFTRSYFVKANLALIYFQISNFHASCQGIWAFLRRPCAWHPSTCAGWVRDFESLWNSGCFH